MLCLWQIQPHCQHLLLLPSAQRNLKQHAFEKTNKKKVRNFEAKATHFRNSFSPPRKQLPKPQQSCIICGETDHFAANCKFNPFNQIFHQVPPNQKPINRRTSIEKLSGNKVKKDRHTSIVKPLAASKNVADQAKPKKPKDKPSATTKSAAAQVKPSAATKSATDKPKSSVATSAADRSKKSGKPPPQQWKAKIPPSIIIGSIECKHAEADDPITHFPKFASSWVPPSN
ncbi:hypothetical protein L1987_63856 [Smallanthus sonchifolius]|uniref:Uncharacterized protein n=1 Tax=Smallanthus sonchifolius TaxID=185202 RepID=A0ACB9CEF7_9ASTR|nr:hypothetical protein L1987_63856 [Smallanthus sonchifolius]